MQSDINKKIRLSVNHMEELLEVQLIEIKVVGDEFYKQCLFKENKNNGRMHLFEVWKYDEDVKHMSIEPGILDVIK